MKNEAVKIGQHCWALFRRTNMLLVVLKVTSNRYEVCGAWECGAAADDLDILAIIELPEDYKEYEIYYLNN